MITHEQFEDNLRSSNGPKLGPYWLLAICAKKTPLFVCCLLSEEGSSHQVGPPVDFPFRGYGPYAINVQNHPMWTMWVSHKISLQYCRMSDVVLHRRLQGPNPWCDNAAAATIVGFTDEALQQPSSSASPPPSASQSPPPPSSSSPSPVQQSVLH